jgi:sugar O-acyltransferase (sialic acid O-acetyltransferase NeuD family)
MMRERIILVGGGGFARELLMWMEHVHAVNGQARATGFLDANPQALAEYSCDLPWVGDIDSHEPCELDRFVLAIGEPLAKRKVVEKMKARGAAFVQVIHPTAVIARTAEMGEGVVVCPHAMVSADAKVGNFVAINAMSSVGHDARVGDYSTLSAHVDITGWVQVDDAVFFGSGARVLPKVRIGAESRIGAGAAILRSVPAGTVMYAPTARRL